MQVEEKWRWDGGGMRKIKHKQSTKTVLLNIDMQKDQNEKGKKKRSKTNEKLIPGNFYVQTMVVIAFSLTLKVLSNGG